jgi:hypothetical protein
MASTVSGCFDCMVRGIDARTCGRIKLNTDVIERHQEETVEFNSIIKSGKISNIMSQEEVEDVLMCWAIHVTGLEKFHYPLILIQIQMFD